jgi:hypothetical protein
LTLFSSLCCSLSTTVLSTVFLVNIALIPRA